MDAKTFSLVAGVIFAVVALFHLARIFMEWIARIQQSIAELSALTKSDDK